MGDDTPAVEFVNRELAESEAARAIGLLNQSDEAKVEAWFAMQTVADQVGPASNLGIKGLSWGPPRNGRKAGRYIVSIRCRDGHATGETGAPATLEEAHRSPHIDRACDLLGRLMEESGGASGNRRSEGTSLALRTAVSATSEGRAWIQSFRHPVQTLRGMVRIADTYGRDGVWPCAGYAAHLQFLHFNDRASLIREYPSADAARMKAMALRRNVEMATLSPQRISQSLVTNLALRSGVTTREARTILRAFLDGRSKAKFIRAVNEAARMIEEIETRAPTREAVAA